ncbi:MarR family winged helix-turn-helix transcriptional regulator [Sphingobium nicotianae]|uniref:MarR family transcriptional regulator n=1 Tax=Sphingobium nicotianae TaxID=2782607 RepID=A0A9X1AJI8_9SPHN|nr:MarR family transcriptional regulator [Sphingobium nicotianae]MBT2185363.1 MarR family transcriptional regulator [Sphingobium nicotianae]
MNLSIESPRDLIATLGYLCLGSRLKRLGERMQTSVAQHLGARGHEVQPAQLPLLWALQEHGGAMTIGALGERLGISQPGVSRAIASLEGQGLVRPTRAGKDRRQRQIAISPAGEALMADLSARFFPAVQRAVEQLCLAAGPDLLARIDRIEDDLADAPLEARIAAQLAKADA